MCQLAAMRSTPASAPNGISPAYAPLSKYISCTYAVIRPSFVTPVLTRMTAACFGLPAPSSSTWSITIFTGRPVLSGELVGQRFVEGRSFRAEISPDVHGVDDDRLLPDAHREGQRLPESERRLVGRPHVCASVVLHGDDTGARLEERRVRPAAAVLVLEYQVGLGESRGHVADPERCAEERVGRLRGRAAEPFVFAHAGMDEARLRLHRFQCIQQGRHLFVLHDDHAGGRPLCRLLVVGGNDCDLLACEPDDILGQQRQVAHLSSLQPALDVGPGQHRANTGERLRTRDVDALDVGSGVGASQRLGPERAGWANVERIQRAAGRLVRPLCPAGLGGR